MDDKPFKLPHLKLLLEQLEHTDMVGGALTRRIIKQYISQLIEYQQVIHDTKIMIEALKSAQNTDFADSWYNCMSIDEVLVKKALETSTAQFIESLHG